MHTHTHACMRAPSLPPPMHACMRAWLSKDGGVVRHPCVQIITLQMSNCWWWCALRQRWIEEATMHGGLQAQSRQLPQKCVLCYNGLRQEGCTEGGSAPLPAMSVGHQLASPGRA